MKSPGRPSRRETAENADFVYAADASVLLWGEGDAERNRSRLRALVDSGELRAYEDDKGRRMFARGELAAWRAKHDADRPSSAMRAKPLAMAVRFEETALLREEEARTSEKRAARRAIIDRRRKSG